jgi:hypothetical protein
MKIYWQPFLAQKMLNQEQPEDVQGFKFLGSLIRNKGNHVKLNPGLPQENQHLKTRSPANWTDV